MRTIEEEIDLRTEQRKRYFENPRYRKLSDYFNINDDEYGELSDCYLFYRYVVGGSGFTRLTKDDVERAIIDKIWPVTNVRDLSDIVGGGQIVTLGGSQGFHSYHLEKIDDFDIV